jgi:hypothetical protein
MRIAENANSAALPIMAMPTDRTSSTVSSSTGSGA